MLDEPYPESPRPPAAEEWHLLVREIENCERCELYRTRNHVVVYRGGPTPRIVFVGEAPGAEEDRTGLPFQGRSGRRLDEAVGTLGLGSSEFGIVNLIKCRPPQNRFDPRAQARCRPYLDRQLDLLRPERLVTLGAHALRVLDPSAPPVLTAAGQPRHCARGPLFPLVHPAAALRSRRLAERWTADVRALRGWLANGPAQPV